MSKSKEGSTRKALATFPDIGEGSSLTKALEELEQCGFIRKYKNYTKPEYSAYYQLVDPFVLFSLKIQQKEKTVSWMDYINTPAYHAWRGNAFEIAALNHIPQIKETLGISGVSTEESAWRSKASDPGAQIDLLIDRRDGVINLCEMKFSNEPYEITEAEYRNLQRRRDTFQKETNCKKAIHITLVSANGIKKNKYSEVTQNEITGNDLFR